MALDTEPNPRTAAALGLRIRFHSVGGYGTIATGKLLTDILAGVLDLHSQVRAEIRLGEERRADQLLHHAEPRAGEDHQCRARGRRDRGRRPTTRCSATPTRLRDWSTAAPSCCRPTCRRVEVWRELPERARQTIREKKIKLLRARRLRGRKAARPDPRARDPDDGHRLHRRRLPRTSTASPPTPPATPSSNKIRQQLEKKFGSKGAAVVEGNMAVINEGLEATQHVDYDAPEFARHREKRAPKPTLTVAISAEMCRLNAERLELRPFRPRVLR